MDGVTKLGRLSYSSDKLEVQAENLRKMFLAMAKDIRVIIIKLADRLHNMRTLQFMTPEKQKEKAKETMDIYAPIAQRLGISKIKTELDDLALKYSQPEVFFDLVRQINARKTVREEFVEQIVKKFPPYEERQYQGGGQRAGETFLQYLPEDGESGQDGGPDLRSVRRADHRGFGEGLLRGPGCDP